jgi:hypothetical protein
MRLVAGEDALGLAESPAPAMHDAGVSPGACGSAVPL